VGEAVGELGLPAFEEAEGRGDFLETGIEGGLGQGKGLQLGFEGFDVRGEVRLEFLELSGEFEAGLEKLDLEHGGGGGALAGEELVGLFDLLGHLGEPPEHGCGDLLDVRGGGKASEFEPVEEAEARVLERALGTVGLGKGGFGAGFVFRRGFVGMDFGGEGEEAFFDGSRIEPNLARQAKGGEAIVHKTKR